ncbi:hypothetical protein CDAR_59271, partial [Caerostris darwini]
STKSTTNDRRNRRRMIDESLNSSEVGHHPVGISHMAEKRAAVNINGIIYDSFRKEICSDGSVTHQTTPRILFFSVPDMFPDNVRLF